MPRQDPATLRVVMLSWAWPGPNVPGERREIVAYTHVNSKGQTYYLHGKEVVLKNGWQQRIHYFAREVRPAARIAQFGTLSIACFRLGQLV